MISIINRPKKGFTLIELVVVILILAIMASIGVSRFISLGADARRSTVEGMNGALRAAVLLSRARYKVNGSSGSTVSMDGTSVDVTGSGIPCASAGGIAAAMFSSEGFSTTATTGTACDGSATIAFQPDDGGGSTCQVSYSESGATTVTTTGC